MRAGGVAGGADIADGLALRDVIADRHGQGRLVCVEGGIAVAVVDDDVIAPGAGIGRGRDRAGLRGKDGRTGRRAEVNAVMPAVLLGQRVDAVAVGIGDLALIRQRIQPAAGIGRAGGIAAGAFVVILAVERGDAFGLFLGQGRIINS